MSNGDASTKAPVSYPKRQAVVVIHGIGEQKPMDTLRGFADAVLEDVPPDSRLPKFFNKPEAYSGLYELRCLTAPQTRTRPITDFLEFYWAYQMKGTQFSHLFHTLRELLFRRPATVPHRLLPWWMLIWVLILLALLFSIWMSFAVGPARFSAAIAGLGAGGMLAVILRVLHGVLLQYAGDAARYLSATPTNIEIRHAIRKSGLELLRRIHESGRYDRLIVVGHSLGSVIAYDLLCLYWQETRKKHCRPETFQQTAKDEAGKYRREDPLDETSRSVFRTAQVNLWREQRGLGNPWLISDLVTLGSPLTHAEVLITRNREEFEQRIRERELPTCPPVGETGMYKRDRETYETGGKKRTICFLHHAAPFSCTRWTNLFFPGDLIGGPLNGSFGCGVEDIQVNLGGRFPENSILSHTRYWRPCGSRGDPATPAVQTLRRVLDLDGRKEFGFVSSCPRPNSSPTESPEPPDVPGDET